MIAVSTVRRLHKRVKIVYIVSVINNSCRLAAHGSSSRLGLVVVKPTSNRVRAFLSRQTGGTARVPQNLTLMEPNLPFAALAERGAARSSWTGGRSLLQVRSQAEPGNEKTKN